MTRRPVIIMLALSTVAWALIATAGYALATHWDETLALAAMLLGGLRR